MELIHLFIDNTPIAYCVLDREYRIVYYNKRFADMRGVGGIIPLGIRCYDLITGGMRCRNCAVAEVLSKKQKAFISRKDMMADGSNLFIDDYAIPLQFDAAGEVEYVLEIMIDRTHEMRVKEQRNADYDEMLALLSSLLESKDTYTAAHSDSVRRLSVALAKRMRLPPEEIFRISVAASLHDIGKISVPSSIINKPGKLTEEEYNIIKRHPIASSEILDGLSSFEDIRQVVLHHHERVDGKGYPDGLRGDELPRGSKIVAVADTYDAITSNRSYRPAQSHWAAIEELRRVSGTQLDPDAVSAFLTINFSHLDDKLYPALRRQANHVVREVRQPVRLQTDHAGYDTSSGDFDREVLISRILENTPCGYVFMDREGKVSFVSDYFCSYMGLNKDDIMMNSCHGIEQTCNQLEQACPISLILQGISGYYRMERQVGTETRIFDLYGVPTADSSYVIGMIIDRGEEAQLERARENDMRKLAATLSSVLDKQKGEVDTKKIYSRIGRLNSLRSSTGQ